MKVVSLSSPSTDLDTFVRLSTLGRKTMSFYSEPHQGRGQVSVIFNCENIYIFSDSLQNELVLLLNNPTMPGRSGL